VERKFGEFGKSRVIRQTKIIQISTYNYNLLAESIHSPNFTPTKLSCYTVFINLLMYYKHSDWVGMCLFSYTTDISVFISITFFHFNILTSGYIPCFCFSSITQHFVEFSVKV